jgi:hypothetical protein
MHNYNEDDKMYKNHHPAPFHSRLVDIKNENDIPGIIEFISPKPMEAAGINIMRPSTP